jgi:hypothetical protein
MGCKAQDHFKKRVSAAGAEEKFMTKYIYVWSDSFPGRYWQPERVTTWRSQPDQNYLDPVGARHASTSGIRFLLENNTSMSGAERERRPKY